MATFSSQSTLLTGSTQRALPFPGAFNDSLTLKLDRNNPSYTRPSEGFDLGTVEKSPQYIEDLISYALSGLGPEYDSIAINVKTLFNLKRFSSF